MLTSRTITALVALCVIWLSGSRVQAQYMTHEWVLSVGAGLSDPTGEFEEQYRSGTNLVLDLGHHLNPSWLVGLRAGYMYFDAEADWQQTTQVSHIRYLNLDLNTRLMLYPESWFTPYLLGGLGANLETQTYDETAGERAEDVARIGFTGGIGLSLHKQARRLSVYTELIYHHFPVPDGSRQFVRWTTGLRLSFGGRPF